MSFEGPKNSMHSKETKPFALLTPQKIPPRLDRITICPPIVSPQTDPILRNIFHNRPSTFEPMALDFETMGLPLEHDSTGWTSRPVGIGLADSRGSWYIDLQSSHPDTYKYIVQQLDTLRIPLLAHNMYFDASWIMRDWNIWLNWKACTLAIYKLTATEGWPSQRWGLKDAQVDLLGWEETNEVELDKWLLENGYGSSGRPDKGEMWRAPASILGKYCALDADSTYQLYTHILEPVLKKFKALNIYCTVYYPKYERILIEQTLSGIRIDMDRLHAHEEITIKDLEEAKAALFKDPTLRPLFDSINMKEIAELAAAEPRRHTKVKERPPEPPRFTKSGKPSKTWETWVKNEGLYVPQISKNWLKWQEKYKATLNVEHFNINSYQQKKNLFYNLLYPKSHLTELKRRQGDREITEPVFKLITEEREVLLPLTKSGGIPVDRKALRQMGAIGKLFLNINDLTKELQFIEALKENAAHGRLYPQFRVPGTLSGRLAGGGARRKDSKGFNIQQIPKSPGFLRCFVPDEGWVFIDTDFSALEQVVLAELSRDPALLQLYGPDASQNQDVYLFNGANLPGIGERIRAAGYNPDMPPGDSSILSEIKSKCKKERNVAKIVTLGASYKMGPAKLQRTLELEGIKVSFEEAKSIHRGYWDLYKGVKQYDYELVQQYEDNKGWVLNGIGRPLGIYEPYVSDIVNRVAQSSGHDCLVRYLIFIEELLRRDNVPFKWVIADFHDETIIQVPKEYADKAMGIKVEAMKLLNQWAKGYIPFKGTPEAIPDLSYAKCDKEDIKQYLKDLGILDEEEE